MKKLAGLLAFAVALACAILLTKYYSSRPAPAPPPSAPAASRPAPAADASANAPVTFKTQLVTLDLSKFGEKVTAAAPPAAQVYESKNGSLPGLGGVGA